MSAADDDIVAALPTRSVRVTRAAAAAACAASAASESLGLSGAEYIDSGLSPEVAAAVAAGASLYDGKLVPEYPALLAFVDRPAIREYYLQARRPYEQACEEAERLTVELSTFVRICGQDPERPGRGYVADRPVLLPKAMRPKLSSHPLFKRKLDAEAIKQLVILEQSVSTQLYELLVQSKKRAIRRIHRAIMRKSGHPDDVTDVAAVAYREMLKEIDLKAAGVTLDDAILHFQSEVSGQLICAQMEPIMRENERSYSSRVLVMRAAGLPESEY